jgi:hypothetical protein
MQKREQIPWLICLWMMVTACLFSAQQTKKPNILVIFGDDIGLKPMKGIVHGSLICKRMRRSARTVGENAKMYFVGLESQPRPLGRS